MLANRRMPDNWPDVSQARANLMLCARCISPLPVLALLWVVVGLLPRDQPVSAREYADGVTNSIGDRQAGSVPASAPITDTADAFLRLIPQGSAPPNGGTASVGDRFVLELWLNAGSNSDAAAQQSYITFPWQLLQNARVSTITSTCTLATTLTGDHTVFDVDLQNEVCNGPYPCGHEIQVPPGSIGYASGAYNNPPTGGYFRVAQIGLCAVAPGQAVLHWQFTPPDPIIRDTEVVNTNSDVISDRTLFTDYVINVVTLTATPTPVPALLVGHVRWQGRPSQPNTLQQVPVTLTLKMGATEVNFPSQSTDASGFFTVSVIGLPSGTYNWRVKGSKYLANAGSVTLTGGPVTNVEIGLMRTGDSDDNNVVNINDFGIVQHAFGRTVGDGRYDDRAEFTGDQVVNVNDFNLMKMNFGQSGAPPIQPTKH